MKVHDVKCNKLTPKYDLLYAPYHIEIRVDTYELRNALDLFMAAEAWPTGVLVRRFFRTQNGGTQES